MAADIGIFSFFAGAGFLDLGFEKSGHYETLFVNEFHSPFMDIYKGSREAMGIESPMFGYDVGDIGEYLTNKNLANLKRHLKDARARKELVGFIGGPPCPDFSIGGKNKGHEGDNGKLSGTYIDLIVRTQPDFFLFENVKGLYRTTKHRQFFDMLKLRLIRAGYYLTEKLINAIEFGAPQDRERIILLGFKRSILKDAGFVVNGSPIISNFNWSQHTLFNADEVFGLDWPSLEPFEEGGKRKKPRGIITELTIQHWFDKNDILGHPNQQHYFKPRAGLAKFQTILEGDDLKKSYKRLHRWRFSPTAAYGNNEVHLHPYQARRISAAEALAIQSLPKEFVIPEHISLTDMFKTVGNGVPFLAAKGLANTIVDFLYNNPNKDLKQGYEYTHGGQFSIGY
jgi:DNA (cytosine-5)-methyltransferase 1